MRIAELKGNHVIAFKLKVVYYKRIVEEASLLTEIITQEVYIVNKSKIQ